MIPAICPGFCALCDQPNASTPKTSGLSQQACVSTYGLPRFSGGRPPEKSVKKMRDIMETRADGHGRPSVAGDADTLDACTWAAMSSFLKAPLITKPLLVGLDSLFGGLNPGFLWANEKPPRNLQTTNQVGVSCCLRKCSLLAFYNRRLPKTMVTR